MPPKLDCGRGMQRDDMLAGPSGQAGWRSLAKGLVGNLKMR